MDLADRIQEQAGEIDLLEARDSGDLIRRTISDVTPGDSGERVRLVLGTHP